MFLRRIAAHFRKQEWTAIALEFVIVVVGVFVGLQVDNWNQARAESKRETYYLVALKDDFSTVIAELEHSITMFLDERRFPSSASMDSERILEVLPSAEFRNVAAAKWDIVTDTRSMLLVALDEARAVESLLVEEVGRKN